MEITEEMLEERIALMEALADAFDEDAEYFHQRSEEMHALHTSGNKPLRLTLHYLNMRDDHRRNAHTDREDATICRALLEKLRTSQ